MDHSFDQYASGIIQHFGMKRKGLPRSMVMFLAQTVEERTAFGSMTTMGS